MAIAAIVSQRTLAFKEQAENDDNWIISSNHAVVLRDKYPKARYHFLVVPRSTGISNIFDLTRAHLPLLKDMYRLANKVIALQKSFEFLIGFTYKSLIEQLHMHVISNDFISVLLDKRIHCNYFNTNIFLPYRAAFVIVKINGTIKPLTAEQMRTARNAPPKCNQCNFVTDKFIFLKIHLKDHFDEKNKKFNPIMEKKSLDKSISSPPPPILSKSERLQNDLKLIIEANKKRVETSPQQEEDNQSNKEKFHYNPFRQANVKAQISNSNSGVDNTKTLPKRNFFGKQKFNRAKPQKYQQNAGRFGQQMTQEQFLNTNDVTLQC